MRPVTRGQAPKTYAAYQDAIGDLEARLGRYCSYCERYIPVSLAVEHIVAKSTDPSRRTDWNNFLLACANCNSAKQDKPTNDDDFIWPDRDNTLRAFVYLPGGLVEKAAHFDGKLTARIHRLIDLVGLDRHPGQEPDKQPALRDKRYADREEVWKLASLKRDALRRYENDELRQAIVDLAAAKGFFSIWMTVFNDCPDMRRRFFTAFVGTARDCFNDNWDCLCRPGGVL